MEVVRRPDDRERTVHEHRRLPHSLHVRVADPGELLREPLERSATDGDGISLHACGVLNAVSELHAGERARVACGHGAKEFVHRSDDGVARRL